VDRRGLVSLIGALSYVEMACAFPDAGGEYSFLTRAWGSRVGALYAWSRFAVMHTGWIALMAHLLADYVSALVPWGPLDARWSRLRWLPHLRCSIASTSGWGS
jgi:amino acid transporter